jgi:hypothetical protein
MLLVVGESRGVVDEYIPGVKGCLVLYLQRSLTASVFAQLHRDLFERLHPDERSGEQNCGDQPAHDVPLTGSFATPILIFPSRTLSLRIQDHGILNEGTSSSIRAVLDQPRALASKLPQAVGQASHKCATPVQFFMGTEASYLLQIRVDTLAPAVKKMILQPKPVTLGVMQYGGYWSHLFGR